MVWKGDTDRPQRGSVVVSVSASDTGTAAVTFDPPFSAGPIVSVSVIGSSVYIPSTTGGPTTGGMTVLVRHFKETSATTSITVHWTAQV